MEILLEVCFLEEAEEKAAVTTPQSALHSLQRSRREIRFSTKLPQCFLLNLDIFVFFRPIYLSVRLRVFFIGPKSNHWIALPCQFVTNFFETWLMWPWRVKIHETSPKVTQPVIALSPVASSDSHFGDNRRKKHFLVARTKQTQCCWCNICQSHNMELSKLWYGFVKVVTWICWICNVELSKFWLGFV